MELLNPGPARLPDAELDYIPGFLPSDRADALFGLLLGQTNWRQDDIRIFGKTYPQPRLTALYGVSGRPYSYSGITMHPEPFPPAVQTLGNALEALTGHAFNTCLVNLYRNGDDSNGWHADNERELGENPVIASVSLGHTRAFHLKHRSKPSLRFKLLLEHGSLLLMGGAMQHHWLHQVPKTQKPVGQRINLTFRYILG